MTNTHENFTVERCTANQAQAKQIMQWRNDPETLAASFNSTPKTWPAFWDEYCEEYIHDTELTPIFVLKDNQPIAMLRFREIPNQSSKTTDISINIAPEFRGQKLGPAIIRTGIEYLKQHTTVAAVIAEIKSHHIASIKVFEKAGFTFLETTQKVRPEPEQPIPINRYIYNLTQ